MKVKRKLKKKFVVFLSLYALFLGSYFTVTTISKYTSFLDFNGNASVAKWDVSIGGQDNIKLSPMIIGDSETYQTYDLSVTSKSDIAINYSVNITNVPAGVQIKVDNSEPYSAINNTISIENLGNFNVGDKNHTRNHKFTILVPLGTTPFDEQELGIDVIFNQID